MVEGQAFMMTDEGIVPIKQDGTPQVVLRGNADKLSEINPLAKQHVEPVRYVAPQAVAATPSLAVSNLTPKDLIKQARIRVREIKSQLRTMKLLEKEKQELERLIAAAKQKPVAIVRNIKQIG